MSGAARSPAGSAGGRDRTEQKRIGRDEDIALVRGKGNGWKRALPLRTSSAASAREMQKYIASAMDTRSIDRDRRISSNLSRSSLERHPFSTCSSSVGIFDGGIHLEPPLYLVRQAGRSMGR